MNEPYKISSSLARHYRSDSATLMAPSVRLLAVSASIQPLSNGKWMLHHNVQTVVVLRCERGRCYSKHIPFGTILDDPNKLETADDLYEQGWRFESHYTREVPIVSGGSGCLHSVGDRGGYEIHPESRAFIIECVGPAQLDQEKVDWARISKVTQLLSMGAVADWSESVYEPFFDAKAHEASARQIIDAMESSKHAWPDDGTSWHGTLPKDNG